VSAAKLAVHGGDTTRSRGEGDATRVCVASASPAVTAAPIEVLGIDAGVLAAAVRALATR
jgi:hypothetical protein